MIGNEFLPEQIEALKRFLFAGQKIEAIKLYRRLTGAGLAEAKTAVDKAEADLRVAEPGSFSAAAGRSGCGAALFAFTIFGSTVLICGTWWLHSNGVW
jgi:hypothetical protein